MLADVSPSSSMTDDEQAHLSACSFYTDGAVPVVALVRHAERADKVISCAWNLSRDAARFPCDPPITSSGITEARCLAKRLLSMTSTVARIRTSPYLRCVQTALIMAEELDAMVEIDHHLGEVMNREACGDLDMDNAPWRPGKELLSALQDMELMGHSYQTFRLQLDRARGQPPSWPESKPRASVRYAARFMTYLRRSLRTKEAVVLVSHAEAVSACAHVMPTTCCMSVDSVDFCGALIAGLSDDLASTSASMWKVFLTGVKRESNPDFSRAKYSNKLHQIMKSLGWTRLDSSKVLWRRPEQGQDVSCRCPPDRFRETDEACTPPPPALKKPPWSDLDLNSVEVWDGRRQCSTASVDSETHAFDDAARHFEEQTCKRRSTCRTGIALMDLLPHSNFLLKRRAGYGGST
eukprot:TRINITY_DN40527_c0_g1_i1.p1 TRINITY_DN40527_c0_g1~~TRINITY_DN40527_c0_g1_i1.p1  ORF type:complete len:408 (-),score=50.03 TRINITY_DN40527_c0_g1_i1:29-1252(-)